MTIVTYPSRVSIPNAVRDFILANDVSDRNCNKDLVAFIKSFDGSKTSSIIDYAMNPDRLYAADPVCEDGITRQTYYGYHKGIRAVVAIELNTYDENEMSVYINENPDGSETLLPVPTFVPDVNIPGLYRTI